MSSAPLSSRQSWDDRIEIAGVGSATYRFDTSLPKPCVHPLITPAGHRLSGFEMSDHVWHRGLWFTIKFVNGTNFWEEQAPFGVQVSQAQPVCEFIAPGAVRVTHLLEWKSEATGVAIRERRTMTFRDEPSGASIIDWTSELHATQDLLLDRTPYTTWGGYGGLAFRSARELHNASFILPNGETATGLAGQTHDWVIMQGDVDGGPSQHVSIAMIDHPTNPRSPTPWYCKTGNGFNYINPALLFHEPMKLAREQTLKLAYRVLYRDGQWTTDEFTKLAQDFRR